MDIFNVLTLLGGLCLFLFGMNIMGDALERSAGNNLRNILSKFTTKKSAGFLTGLGVTAIIQSSSATTVMVVGFVNSGLLVLKQAINVIMGANVGTTVTAWILSLSGIDGDSLFVKLLKPTSFTPILAVIGIVFYMFCKSVRKKNIGLILLGFATLMFGMDTMSASVSGLKDVPEFQNLFLMFTNPILGVLAGAILTAIIQSSSASVGILQALASTGQVSYGAAIPIIMGQNIGTCITAMLSAIGANKNARRAALVHLSFNTIGTIVWLAVFYIVKITLSPALLGESATLWGIAVAHSVFNILCTIILLPMSNLLEKLVNKLVPDDKAPESDEMLDERLLATPAIALERCRSVANSMAECSANAMISALVALKEYTPALATQVRENEEKSDHYEDILGSYLVKLSSYQIGENESAEAAMLLKAIGDFERISDHSVNILESVEELREKDISFTEKGRQEILTLSAATTEIINLSVAAFKENNLENIGSIEALEKVVDNLKETLRSRHIKRLQQGECTIDVGFVWSDLLTDLERVSDHCSNIAGCVVDFAKQNMNFHENLRAVKSGEDVKEEYARLSQKYSL